MVALTGYRAPPIAANTSGDEQNNCDCEYGYVVTLELQSDSVRFAMSAIQVSQSRKLLDNSAMHASLVQQIPNIAVLCERYGVSHLELFGSATGPDFDPASSDFDFLVELDKHATGSRGRRWTELADALETLLGRRVDLVNPQYVRNPYFLKAVNESRTVIYDRQSTKAPG